MKKLGLLLLSILLSSVLLQAAGSKLAVLELKCAGLPEYFPPILTEKLRREIAKTGEFTVISKDQMINVLGEDGYIKTASIQTDKSAIEACLALKSKCLIYGDIGKLGTTYFLNLKLLDFQSGKVIMQINKEIRGSEDDLISLTEAAARELKDQPQINQIAVSGNTNNTESVHVDSLKMEMSIIQDQIKSETAILAQKQRTLDNLQSNKDKLMIEKELLEKSVKKEEPQTEPSKTETPQIEELKPSVPTIKREELKD